MRKCLSVMLLLLAALRCFAFAGEEKVLVVDQFDGSGPKFGRGWEIYVDANDLGSKANDFPRVKEDGPPNSKGHGHFSGHVGKNKSPFPWIVLELEFADDGPKDVSGYNSLRFLAKGDGKKYRLRICRTAIEDHCHFEYVFTAPKEWTPIVAPLNEFVQPNWGKQVAREFKDVNKVGFLALAPGNDEEFSLRFTNMEFATVPPAKDKK